MESRRMETAELPPEVIEIEILPRLPVKTLLRFKAVCSTWRKTIGNPNFVGLQLLYSENHQDRILLQDENPSRFFADDGRQVKAPDCSTRFLSYPCNGVFLLVEYYPRLAAIHLWNPSTGKSRKIPLPHSSWAIVTFFNGLWYDPDSGGFRILLVTRRVVYVFDSVSGSWKTVPAMIKLDKPQYYSRAFVDGYFHIRGYGGWILRLSPDGEISTGFRLPPSEPGPEDVLTFVWGGRLCVKRIIRSGPTLEVWRMEEYEDVNSWNRVLLVPPPLKLHPRPCGLTELVLALRRSGVPSCLVQLNAGTVLVPTSNDETDYLNVDIGTQPQLSVASHSYDIETCKESLLNP